MQNLNYGVIGNCKTAALVSEKGSIDWCCMPKFDSSSIFAKLLDTEKGGSFEIIVDDDYEITQKYKYHSNILETKFSNGEDAFEVCDFMPRYENRLDSIYHPNDIIRYIKRLSGKPRFRVKYDPKLEYAKYITKTKIEKDYIKSNTAKGAYDSVYLYTNLDNKKVIDGDEFKLETDAFFLLSYNQKLLPQNVERSYLKLQRTKVYWLNWVERLRKYKKYNEEIIRSALVLKLMTYEKTGAVLAALTTSLPETIGEERNWDYRFCWLRDASMVVRVLSEVGCISVAQKYLNFLVHIIPDKDEKIQIMYGIEGQKKLTEYSLDHLAGYENSVPVREGNAAYKQKQNDIYGILMDAIYQQFHIFETSLESSEDLWTITRSIIKTVEKNWEKPDKGIWEIRNDNKHFVFSKVLCWVAIDRGIKIAEIIRKTEYIKDWRKLRDKIKDDVMNNGWKEKVQAFTQFYGSEDMDASILLMEKFGFIKADDPKYVSTVKAIQKYLQYKGLMFRYITQDDFGIPSSSFTICTFWLINSLYKIGEKDQAIELFDEIKKYGNHLGLYSEDIDFESKRLLGNFPQAYSHLAFIETAINISGHAVSKEESILEGLHLM